MRVAFAVATILVAGAVGVPDPGRAQVTGADVIACRSTITKQGMRYTKKRRVKLLRCIDKMLKCDLRLELDGTNPGTCRSGAISSCTRTLGPAVDSTINLAAQRFRDKVNLACGGLDFATYLMGSGPGGLQYETSATCGAAANLDDLISCLLDALNERVDENVSFVKPRGGILIDNTGLGSLYPNLWRPDSVGVTVAATGAGTGMLVSPGVVAVADGQSITFDGDALTLPCGGSSNNGRLNIRVGSGGTSCTDPAFVVVQEYTIKEPYGAGEVAVFGPFGEDRDYCIDLKDGSCDSALFVSGGIDYP